MVSIHAPARGAPPPRPHRRPVWDVSIHAPARGATSATWTRPGRGRSFNPRPRAGGDHVRPRLHHPGVAVSIHAPARGATMYDHAYTTQELPFQSTPPRGGRPS